MSVDLEPQKELVFKGPFKGVCEQSLFIRNRNPESIAFKVKTTAPKQYCVRPNSGIVGPHDQIEVQILLQPMKEQPPPDFVCKDKFLVQSMVLSVVDLQKQLSELWSEAEKTKSHTIFEQKLRCVYDLEASTASETALYTSSKIPDINVADVTSSESNNNVLAAANKRIQELQNEIEQLTKELSNLRNRKPQVLAGPEKVMTKQMIKHTGYSPQLVVLLSIISFMIGVSFF